MKIDLKLEYSPVFFFILLGVLFVLVFLYYRKTLPPISVQLRLLCAFLRATVLCMVLWLLFKPVIQFTIRKIEKSRIAVLADVSASMTISDENTPRCALVQQFFKSAAYSALKKKAYLEQYAFSDDIHQFQDSESLEFTGTTTNITKALDQILAINQPMPFQAVLLLTDGSHNVGSSPENKVQQWHVPIYTVGFGSSNEKPDILLTEVLSNTTAYVNQEVPIRVSLRSFGFGGQLSSVTLRTENKDIIRLPIKIPEGGLETTVEFRWIPSKPGLHRLIFSIDSIPGELTLSNNQRERYIHVQKHKQKLLLLAGAPSADQGCLRRLFLKDDHTELIVRTQSPEGGFYEGLLTRSDFESLDIIILIDMPTHNTSPAFWQSFLSAYQTYQWSMLIIAGKSIDADKINEFHDELSIHAFGPQSLQWMTPGLTAQGLQHPICIIDDDVLKSRLDWERLPPIMTFWPYTTVSPDAQVLVTGRIESDNDKEIPLVICRSSHGNRNIMLLAGSLYRWKLLMWQDDGSRDLFDHFIMNCMRWLIADDQIRPVRLILDNHVYQAGVPIDLRAEIYDEGLQPAEQATVRLMTIGQKDTMYTIMKPEGAGYYRVQMPPMISGEYQVIAEAMLQGRSLGRDTTSFSISAFHPEFLDTRAHPEVLKLISQKTGGIFVPSDSIEALLSALPVLPVAVENHRQMRPNQQAIYLIIIILLLSVEWWIRRRKGNI